MRVRRLTLCALLSTIALAIFVLEAQIPPIFPIPGFKLGLSNIVTLLALCCLGWKEAAAILLVRIPGTYLTSQLFPDNLFPMGMAAPAGSLFSALICVVMYWWLKKGEP